MGLYMIKEATQTNLGSIWYLLEPSEVPHLTNKELVDDFNVSTVIWSGSSVRILHQILMTW